MLYSCTHMTTVGVKGLNIGIVVVIIIILLSDVFIVLSRFDVWWAWCHRGCVPSERSARPRSNVNSVIWSQSTGTSCHRTHAYVPWLRYRHPDLQTDDWTSWPERHRLQRSVLQSVLLIPVTVVGLVALVFLYFDFNWTVGRYLKFWIKLNSFCST